MDLRSYLDQQGVNYQWRNHPTAYTAQDLAAREHIPGGQVIKPVVVQADGQFVMCALPASHKIDLDELRAELRVEDMRLADERELAGLCADCELGAEPPIGGLFGLPTMLDESVFGDDRVTFQAGTHSEAVTMAFADYFRIAKPSIGHFARHL